MGYKFIDLFCGIGGIRLGFEPWGFECVFSSEIDKFAQKTYYENFHEVPNGDITKINADNIPNHDILLAGFPCQPFSMIGKRDGLKSIKNGKLFFEILRILKAKKPSAFLLENVPGILSINNGKTKEVIMKELQHLGYKVTILCENAKDYGVPQNRKRIYFFGFKGSFTVKFNFIKPKLNKIPIGKFIQENVKGYGISENLIKNYLFKKNDNKPQIVDKRSDIQVKTLVSTYHKIQRLTGTFVKDNEKIRLLSMDECKSIMGFPKAFKIPVSRTQMYKQMGNSVAVPVIKELARQIKIFLDKTYENKNK